MPKYTLTYFDGRGLAEISRWLFAVAEQPYDDIRLQYEGDKKEWLELKPTTPFGQLPVLEVDGFKIAQSNTISQYLAQEFGLAGKSPLDYARVSMILQCVWDMVNSVFPIYFEKDEAKKAELKKTFEENLITQLKYFEQFVNQNTHAEHFVGESITLADIAFCVGLEKLDDFDINVHLENYPKLQTLRQKTLSHPKIAEWIAKRPVSKF